MHRREIVLTDISELNGFDDELEKLRVHWDAPGISCVALKDNEIIYSHAVGLRDIGKNLPMTPHTIQPIGSCSKSFTSTAVAMLVEDGKLDWDTPVHKMFPKFELKDPTASAKTTLVDMLSHRTGLPRHDAVWMDGEFTYDQIFDYLPHLDFSRDFRTTFQYNNLMYIAAAAIVEEISGVNFRKFVSKRIFKPLKINANMFLQDMLKDKDHTKGYLYLNAERSEVKYDAIAHAEDIAVTGAGTINAGTADIAEWLKFHLNIGTVDGKQLLSPENIKRTHTPVVIGGYSRLDEWVPGQKWIKQSAYALGWHTEIYRGFTRVSHSGHTEGSSTKIYFLPGEGIGVGVMVNEYGNPLTDVIGKIILDKLLKLEPVDWSKIIKPSYDEFLKVIQQTKEKEADLRIADTKPAHLVENYCGNYHNPGYGTFAIISEEGELRAMLGSLKFRLTHYHYDTFQYHYDRQDFRDTLTFYTESSGDIESFTIRLEMQVPPIRFIRLPDEHMSDPEFLGKIVGKYEYYGRPAELVVKGENTLVFMMAGLPPMELIPIRGMRFKPKHSSSKTFTFQEDTNGEIAGFLVSEFGNVIPAKRIKS
ncbi:serine hydrolase [Candidatus Thorarchaeota archaeon]|nr:MAG: serine hydrolase [Candidatus Thorarchaeota archaeon]